jgi:outer membrane protein assembly factor BamB
MNQSVLAALSLFLASAPRLAADAWPQFRGPAQQGHSDAKGVPLTWSETERVKWKTALPGEGWSSPVVADGQVWMTTALDEGRSLRALCADLATGKLIHDIEVFRPTSIPPKHRRNSYASPTPILADGRVYVHFGSMGTAALDARTGRKLWENHELVIDHQNGPGGSPLLFKDKLLIACDGIDAQFEAALDIRTGQVAWKTERSAIPELAKLPPDMRKAYGTPTLFTIDGKPQTLTTASNRLYALDPETGREIWHADYPRGFSNVPLPVSDGRVLVVSTGFMKPEMWAFRVGGMRGDVSSSHLLWKQKAGAPDQSSPVLVDGRLYMVSSGGIASCLDAQTGEILWKERIGSDFAASPVHVDRRIYFCGCDGVTTVIEPGPTFKVLAKNQIESGFMASPAVVGRAFILRTRTHLYRIE